MGNIADKSFALLVGEKLYTAMKFAKDVEKIADDFRGIEFRMNLLPLKITEIEGRPWVFVPTGTKEQPAGISNNSPSHATGNFEFVCMMDKDENVIVFHTDVVKDYIKKHLKVLKWKIDEWYEVMGFELSLVDLIKFEANARG